MYTPLQVPVCMRQRCQRAILSPDAPRYVPMYLLYVSLAQVCAGVLLLPNAMLRERHQHRVAASKREGERSQLASRLDLFGLKTATGRFLHEKPTRTGSWDCLPR